jgi:hypothetical protein
MLRLLAQALVEQHQVLQALWRAFLMHEAIAGHVKI